MKRRDSFRAGAGLLLAGMVLAGTGLVQAENKVYRWVDAEGKVHYGDLPPTPKAEPLQIRRPNAMSAPGAAPSEAVSQECASKLEQIERYRSAGTITETDGLGVRREYSLEQKQQLVQRLEATYRDLCGEVPTAVNAVPAASDAGNLTAPSGETPDSPATEPVTEPQPEPTGQ